MTSLRNSAQDYEFNLINWLVKLLSTIGYYSFNRYMVAKGYNLKFTMYIHKMSAKKSLIIS